MHSYHTRNKIRIENALESSFRRLPTFIRAQLINAAQREGMDPLVLYQQRQKLSLDTPPPLALSCEQHLENYTGTESDAPEEGAEMAKNRIRRRIQIGGTQQWVTASTEQEYAENLYALMKREKPAAQKHLFGPYAQNWFELYSKPSIAETTAVTYNRQLRKHLLPVLGERFLEDITADDLQQLYNNMSGAKATKDKAKIVLNMILDSAVDEGIIPRNPGKAKKIKVVGRQSQTTEPYTKEQMRYLAQRLSLIQNAMDRTYMALQLLHPLRLEEVLGLKWKDIDLKKRNVH